MLSVSLVLPARPMASPAAPMEPVEPAVSATVPAAMPAPGVPSLARLLAELMLAEPVLPTSIWPMRTLRWPAKLKARAVLLSTVSRWWLLPSSDSVKVWPAPAVMARLPDEPLPRVMDRLSSVALSATATWPLAVSCSWGVLTAMAVPLPMLPWAALRATWLARMPVAASPSFRMLPVVAVRATVPPAVASTWPTVMLPLLWV